MIRGYEDLLVGALAAMMGAVHQKRDHPIEAIMEYSQAVKLNVKDISSFVNRGEIYLRHRNYRKARASTM